MSAFDDMPSLFIPKKRCHEEIPHLTDRKDRLSSESDKARKKLKAHGSCNAQFWSAAAEVEAIVLSKTRVVSEISLAEFEGEPSAWECTEEAKMLFEQMRAQQVRMTSYRKQALTLTRKRGSLRESFMNLFTSSRMGLGIATGMGPRDSSVQSNFRRNLLADYESVGENGLVWCPIIQDWFHSDFMTASHLFSYRHGQATMDVIFGKVRPAELFSSRNGLIMCSIIERYFDAGVMVIVPNIPERPTNSMLSNWIRQEIREYKFRIIDSSWDQLDRVINNTGLTWRKLDNRVLQFRGSYRPAARYVYFHYCLQVLRRAWKVGPGQRAAFYLTDELGKPFWGTPGRYIAKHMLRALVEELGHEFEHLMGGATLMSRGDDDLLLSTAAAQVVQVDGSDDDDTDDDDMDEEDYF
ncbi:hypothetical protein BDV37DRAFT_280748 [Aspergillus pseudonomiae]|uniref:HNH nuclease domain-containing protein n=1 Tax=Aspergillus pseudonomiae TaxID=1506151 RepID=A0A5N7DJ54_9EURO|nr:uncharacterized protein BDV37DRAFT_280748 [Aspergillus pseudonomiae]KAE8406467.1 hypothetical protein BDV37DRAFT_280748 [Aspergillus pseudonomiae]